MTGNAIPERYPLRGAAVRRLRRLRMAALFHGSQRIAASAAVRPKVPPFDAELG